MLNLKQGISLPKFFMLSNKLNDLLLNINIELEQNETFQNTLSAQLRKRDWRIVVKQDGKYFR